MNALEFYLHQYRGKLDPYFGIKQDRGRYFLGDQEVEIKENNIFLDGEEFKGTTGLWALIMENTPKMEGLTEEELDRYKRLMRLTHTFELGQNNYGARRTNKFNLLEDLMIEKGKGI